MTVYTMMLEEKYCDQSGGLLENYPSFYQFRYFYRKTRKLQNYYISRKGLNVTSGKTGLWWVEECGSSHLRWE